MSTTAIELLQHHQVGRRGDYVVRLAHSEQEVTECLRLRYQVFSEEMGAQLSSREPGIDRDRFDAHCKHLFVRNDATGEVIATTRLLTDTDASQAGSFYSETEFNLAPIRALGGRILEVGRTCIHQDYRRGAALAMLWQGIAQVIGLNRIDYLIGCASVPLDEGDSYVVTVLDKLRRSHLAPQPLRCTPYIPLPQRDAAVLPNVPLPPLLKGYLRLGAMICSEPFWDAAFNVADVLILVDRDRIAERYDRHFNRD
jgi:putative hemolysin